MCNFCRQGYVLDFTKHALERGSGVCIMVSRGCMETPVRGESEPYNMGPLLNGVVRIDYRVLSFASWVLLSASTLSFSLSLFKHAMSEVDETRDSTTALIVEQREFHQGCFSNATRLTVCLLEAWRNSPFGTLSSW